LFDIDSSLSSIIAYCWIYCCICDCSSVIHNTSGCDVQYCIQCLSRGLISAHRSNNSPQALISSSFSANRMFSAVSGFTCSALLNPLTPHSHASFVLGSGVSRQRSAADNRLMCLAWLSAVKAYSVTNENVILSRFLVNGSTVRVELSEWRLHNSHRQACAQRSHAGRPIVFTRWSKKGFFAPQGRHIGETLVKDFSFHPASCTVFTGRFWVILGYANDIYSCQKSATLR